MLFLLWEQSLVHSDLNEALWILTLLSGRMVKLCGKFVRDFAGYLSGSDHGLMDVVLLCCLRCFKTLGSGQFSSNDDYSHAFTQQDCLCPFFICFILIFAL